MKRGFPSPAALLLTAIGVPLAAIVRFGYHFGYSDQDEFLPWLAARTEAPQLLADWFVASQASGFNVRSGWVWLLDLPVRLFGAEPVVAVVYAVAAVSLAVSVHLLARRLGAGNVGAVAAALLALALLPRWTLGGNAAWSSMLVPSMVAWALCLTALVLLFDRRNAAAGLVIGVSAWIHVLVAAQVGAIALFALLWRDRRLSGDGTQFAVCAIGLALPVALLLSASGAGVPSESFEVLALYRAPHHYLPSAFPLADWMQFGALAAVGIAALRKSRLKRRAARNRLLTGLLAGVVLALVTGMIGWLADAGWLLSLQPFKASVLGAILLCAGIGVLVPDPALPRWIWAAGVATVLGAAAWAASGGQAFERPRITRGHPVWSPAAEWARSQSPESARFMVPPSSSGFRFAARRAVVANFKAWPFTARGTGEWMGRMEDLGGPPGDLRGTEWLAQMDRTFERLTPARARELMRRYDARFMVKSEPFPDGDTLFVRRAHAGDALIYEVHP